MAGNPMGKNSSGKGKRKTWRQVSGSYHKPGKNIGSLQSKRSDAKPAAGKTTTSKPSSDKPASIPPLTIESLHHDIIAAARRRVERERRVRDLEYEWREREKEEQVDREREGGEEIQLLQPKPSPSENVRVELLNTIFSNRAIIIGLRKKLQNPENRTMDDTLDELRILWRRQADLIQKFNRVSKGLNLPDFKKLNYREAYRAFLGRKAVVKKAGVKDKPKAAGKNTSDGKGKNNGKKK